MKLSANWMAAAGFPGEDAALYDTVRAVALELCPQLGVAIPVGKDSLSMRTTWQDGGEAKEVVAPLSLVVSAFAPSEDATCAHAATADGRRRDFELDPDRPRTRRDRLGSQLAQVYGQIGDTVPDLDDPAALKAFFAEIQSLNRDGLLLAYHDRSDGGLFACACEMAFAGRCGVTLSLDLLGYDPLAHDVDGNERRPERCRGATSSACSRGSLPGWVPSSRSGPTTGRQSCTVSRAPGCTRPSWGRRTRATRSGWSATRRRRSPRGASICSGPGRR